VSWSKPRSLAECGTRPQVPGERDPDAPSDRGAGQFAAG
jgi:hypothetical protein